MPGGVKCLLNEWELFLVLVGAGQRDPNLGLVGIFPAGFFQLLARLGKVALPDRFFHLLAGEFLRFEDRNLKRVGVRQCG